MIDPDRAQTTYEYELLARLRYPRLIEQAVEADFEKAGVDLTEEITRAELLYALESDNHDLRRASTAWYARNCGEEMTIEELTHFMEVDFETV
ncbi:hypothetical protein ACFQ9V_13245 [Leifsonia sp. NPDC056665]|uniref:hypothetical protein n=1 Tax=Leifsonia sp. NPDC056665 TaxID=3345901 RepID=UPI0036912616